MNIAIAIVAVILALVGWLIQRGKSEYRILSAKLRSLNEIDLDEARRQAQEILDRTSLFKCKLDSHYQAADIAALAPEIAAVFKRYEEIERASGNAAKLDRQLLKLACCQPGLILVGRGMEGSDVEFDLGVQPGKEEIVVAYSNESKDPNFGVYRSVYHWIIGAAQGI